MGPQWATLPPLAGQLFWRRLSPSRRNPPFRSGWPASRRALEHPTRWVDVSTPRRSRRHARSCTSSPTNPRRSLGNLWPIVSDSTRHRESSSLPWKEGSEFYRLFTCDIGSLRSPAARSLRSRQRLFSTKAHVNKQQPDRPRKAVFLPAESQTGSTVSFDDQRKISRKGVVRNFELASSIRWQPLT